MVKSTLGCPANRADIAGVRSKWMLSSSSSGILALGFGGAAGCAGAAAWAGPPGVAGPPGGVKRSMLGILTFCACHNHRRGENHLGVADLPRL